MTLPTKFHVTATTHGNQTFFECLLFITNGIRELGYEVTYADAQLDPNAINIVLGSHAPFCELNSWTKLSQQASHIIIYNWEQAASDVPWFTQRYVRQLTKAHVWDYNAKNIEALKQAGIHDIQHVPMSYVSAMQRVPKVEVQDIDVLFYGFMNPRRQAAIDAMRALGLNVVSTAEHQWLIGDERDAMMARSKIILNMHRFDVAKVFEIARVSYPLANAKAVVSEISPETDIDDDIRAAIVGGSIEELPQLCYDLVHDDERRRALEKKGFELFSKRSAAAALKPAIDRYLQQLKQTPPQIGNSSMHSAALPRTIQLAAADEWNFTYLNLDKNPQLAPDLAIDLGVDIPFNQPLNSWRFGKVVLEQGYFDKIIANLFFHRVSDLKIALTNCLNLLKEGGTLHIRTPLDLSHDAWLQIDTMRAFNDTSWSKITDDWWKMGWTEHRFAVIETGYGVHNPFGVKVLTDNGGDWEEGRKIPRVVDIQNLVLVKRKLTDEELKSVPQTRFLD